MFRHATHGLLALAFVTGGSSLVSGWDDTAVQLLSLPLLAVALWRLIALPPSRPRNVALAVAGSIALLPLVQLLPIPEALWRLPAARQQLAADLAAVGAHPTFHWSLAPAATERAFLFLLPPMALFAATVSLPASAHPGLLRSVMLLVVFSLVLAFLQLGAPADSLLHPFPQWTGRFGGVFANHNHQASALALGVVIALCALPESLARRGQGPWRTMAPWALGGVALFCLCTLPFTQSRAGVVLATLACGFVPLGLGLFSRARLRQGWGPRAALVASVAVVAWGAWAAVAWVQLDAVDPLRPVFRDAALTQGFLHAPLGTGMGAFIDAFEQGMPVWLLNRSYVNHVHNDYLQWWMEASWLAVAVATATLAALAWLAARALRHPRVRERAPAVAAVAGLALLLAHSWVDYPLRTGSLAAVAAVLAGILTIRASTPGANFDGVGGEPSARHTS